MAKTTVGAEVQVDFKSVGELRKAIKEANGELLKTQAAFGNTSKEAIEAAKRVADLKDRIKEASETADLFDPGNRFKVVGNAVSALANGFTAVQGALGLLGVKSEDVEKQLLKVQSALALSQGLSAVSDSAKDFQRLASVIKDRVVTAFSTLRGAIISTGIGALVVALGALIANFDKIKNAIDGVSDAQKDLVDQTTKAADKEAEKLATLDSQDNVLRLQGKSETEILELKKKQVGEILEARKQQLVSFKELREQQIAGAKRNQEIVKGILDFITTPLRVLQSIGGKVASFFGFEKIDSVFQRLNAASLEANNRISQYFFDIEDATAETDTKIKEFENDIKSLEDRQADLILNQRKIAADEKKRKDDEAKKLAEEREKLRKELAEQKVKDLQAEADAEAKWLEEQKKINADREAEREKENEEANKRAFERQQKYVQQQLDDAKILAQAETDLQNAKVQAVSSGLNAIAELSGRGTALGKAAALADIALGTSVGFINALDIAQKSAKATGPAAAFAFPIFYATQITAVLSAALRAKNVLSQVKGAGGGGSVSAPQIPKVSTNAPIQAQLSPQAQAQALNANAINNLSTQPTRAYILDRDIQDQNQINSFITRNARI